MKTIKRDTRLAVVFTVRLDPYWAGRLREIATAEERKVADTARRILREGIDRYDRKYRK